MLEKHIVAQICAFLRLQRNVTFWTQPQAGFFDTKRNRFRKHAIAGVMNGTPDIIAIISPGSIFLGIEIKSPTGKLSPAQKQFSELCSLKNINYVVAKSVDDVENALRAILKP